MIQALGAQPPSAAKGDSDWPWTAFKQEIPTTKSDGCSWPKISIVTPSYNQSQFLEETICSIIRQNYPNLEYIVIDGGSTDGSVDILRKYSEHIDYWVSEPDEGQGHAINKGFEHATGDWLAWLNSDDIYLPGALQRVAGVIRANENLDWIVGSTVVADENKVPIRKFEPVCDTDDWTDFLCNKRVTGTSLPQPSSFWSRRAWEKAGKLDETLRYVMDYEYWVRLAKSRYRPVLVQMDLALFRLSEASKSGSGMAKFIKEEKLVVEKYMKGQDAWTMAVLLLYKTFLREFRWYRMTKSRALNALYAFAKHVRTRNHTG